MQCQARSRWCRSVGQHPRPARGKSRRVVKCRTSDDDHAVVSQLPVSVIVSQLKALGQECKYIFEKAELVSLLVDARRAARSKVVMLPLRRTKPTPESPKEYVLVPIDMGNEGFMDFALDTGASGTLITPAARDRLGATASEGRMVEGVRVGGPTMRQQLPLPPMTIGGLAVPPSAALVTDFLSPNLEGVEGMLGMHFLRQFDIELDFERSSVAFYPPGSATRGGILDTQAMYSFTCTSIMGGLMTVLVSLNQTPRFPAVVDLATSFSIMNSKAAQHSNLDAVLPSPYMSGGGDDGQGLLPMFRPATPLMLSIGDQDKGDAVLTTTVTALLVANVAAFETLKMSEAPAMLLAMDVLKQRRLVLSFGCNKMFAQT